MIVNAVLSFICIVLAVLYAFQVWHISGHTIAGIAFLALALGYSNVIRLEVLEKKQ